EALAAYDRARLSGDDQLAKAVLLEGRSRGLLSGFDLDGHDVPVPWVEAISALEDYDSANGSLHRPAQVVGCAGGRQVTGRDDGTRNASSLIDRRRLLATGAGLLAVAGDTVVFPAYRNLVGVDELNDLASTFADLEVRQFRAGAFGAVVDHVAEIQRSLGIYDLNQFTPPPVPP
ncbi:MAG TPA: hypothetical protein VMF65_00220, partial [Acidimicrobiales bacterium]|nr:hypothetical protein [Acidimicrobiales bacterium]